MSKEAKEASRKLKCGSSNCNLDKLAWNTEGIIDAAFADYRAKAKCVRDLLARAHRYEEHGHGSDECDGCRAIALFDAVTGEEP